MALLQASIWLHCLLAEALWVNLQTVTSSTVNSGWYTYLESEARKATLFALDLSWSGPRPSTAISTWLFNPSHTPAGEDGGIPTSRAAVHALSPPPPIGLTLHGTWHC